MITAKINNSAVEDFSVVDSADNAVSGITLTEFTYSLYDPTGAASALIVTFTELGDGHYRASFTPDVIGNWYLIVYHTTYFSTGKAGTIQVSEYDFNDLSMLKTVYNVEVGKWEIFGTQMIFYNEDDTELMRFDLYTDGSGNPIKREPV